MRVRQGESWLTQVTDLHIFQWLLYIVPQTYVTKLSFASTPQTFLPCVAFPLQQVELKEEGPGRLPVGYSTPQK